jgi:hypothetical protein
MVPHTLLASHLPFDDVRTGLVDPRNLDLVQMLLGFAGLELLG